MKQWFTFSNITIAILFVLVVWLSFSLHAAKSAIIYPAEVLNMPRQKISATNFPHIGPEDAPVNIVFLFDYTDGLTPLADGIATALFEKYKGDIKLTYVPVRKQADDQHLLAYHAFANGKFQEVHEALVSREPILDTSWLPRDRDDPLFAEMLNEANDLAGRGDFQLPGFFVNGRYVNGLDPVLVKFFIERDLKQVSH